MPATAVPKMHFRGATHIARLAALLFGPLIATAIAGDERLLVQPDRLELTGTDPEHGLIVTRIDAAGNRRDITAESRFTSNSANVVSVNAAGHCKALSDGEAQIVVEAGGDVVRVSVTVRGAAVSGVPSFRQDVLPILTKAGCNAGGCHGKLAGQNGFRLSLRGYAPEWDHDWVTKEGRGRRINAAFPEESLLVQKPAGGVVHEGGTRFKPGSRFYQTLVNWIAARAPGPTPAEVDATRLEVLPGDREMRPGEKQQLLVRAHYADGRVRDVTWLAQFFCNDETVLSVKPSGLVKALRSGESSVRIHFQGQVEVVRFTMPFAAELAGADFESRQNVIDEPVFKKLRALHIPPSPLCDDQTFLRRAFLDTIGTLPSPEEATAFLADRSPEKRRLLIDELLARPEWVDYWALQFADLLQNRKERDHDVRGVKGVRAFHAWLREQLAQNLPWDHIARAVLLAKGDSTANPAVGYYLTVVGEKRNVEESELPDSVAQSFLGTRIGCARCHNHPLEKYTQDDFYHFAAFFSKVALKRESPEIGPSVLSTNGKEEQELQKRIAELGERVDETANLALRFGEEPGGEEASKAAAEEQRKLREAQQQLAEVVKKAPSVSQPRTGKAIAPLPLDHSEWRHEPGRDTREQFVEWMLAGEQFSGAMVNRLWKHFFAVGLVEPVDDLRASNPPSNPELWRLLSREFTTSRYDLKHVMRLLLNSRTYQLSSETLPGNETDRQFYSHYYARRLPAEVLMDGIATATGAPAQFAGYPLGTRAIQLPEPGVGSYFLTLFGRSERVTACACDRSGEVTLPQLLHLQNSEEMQRQISSERGRLTELLKNTDDGAVLREVFLTTVARMPREAETHAVTAALSTDRRDLVFRDLLWALLNSKEFAFNH